MNEVDYTGFVRTPENISEMNSNDWKRFKLHCRRFYGAIRNNRYDQLSWIFKDIITNCYIW